MRLIIVWLLALLAVPALAQEMQPTLTGDVGIHDLSIIEVEGSYVPYYTGQRQGLQRGTVRTKVSPDGLAWTEAGTIGNEMPARAPSVSRHGDTWYLPHSLSIFGTPAFV